MMIAAFKDWLRDNHYAMTTIASRLAGVSRLESFYGDLDRHFAFDRIGHVDRTLVYSTEDERRNRPNPSGLPIAGRLRTNLATYRSALALYRRFREATPETEPSRLAVTAMRRAQMSVRRQNWERHAAQDLTGHAAQDLLA